MDGCDEHLEVVKRSVFMIFIMIFIYFQRVKMPDDGRERKLRGDPWALLKIFPFSDFSLSSMRRLIYCYVANLKFEMKIH
jgi:hypothetical protein